MNPVWFLLGFLFLAGLFCLGLSIFGDGGVIWVLGVYYALTAVVIGGLYARSTYR